MRSSLLGSAGALTSAVFRTARRSRGDERVRSSACALIVLTLVMSSLVACGGGSGDDGTTLLSSTEIAFLAPPPGVSGNDAVFALPDCSSGGAEEVCGSSVVDLYVVGADGRNKQRLTQEGGFLLEREYFSGLWDRPMWAPDGSSLMLTRGIEDPNTESLYGRFELWSLALDSEGAVRRVASGLAPSWSSDGSSVAYIRSENGAGSVVIADRTGGHERVLVKSAEFPIWSPSGSPILYNPAGKQVTWAVEPDGSATRKLFDGANAEWSPDGSKIAYVGKCAGSDYALCVVAADGSGTHQVAKFEWVGGFAWSPDGTTIAVVDVTYDHDTAGDLYVVRVNGAGLTRIASDVVGYPSWSPDGTRIAIAKLAGSGEDVRQNSASIFTIKPDGSDPQRVTDGPFDLHPAWRPTAG
jgi:Tol biopolymer transport system component